MEGGRSSHNASQVTLLKAQALFFFQTPIHPYVFIVNI